MQEEAVEPARISDLLTEDGVRVWLDVEDPTDADLEMLQQEFSLHPLSIEDTKHRRQRPKVEVYEDYFFVVMHALRLGEKDEFLDSEIHAFAGKRFLITLRYPPVFDLSGVMTRWDRQPELTSQGGGFLLYALLDEVVDDYFDVVERYEDKADEIEDKVFVDAPDQSVQRGIFKLKHEVVEFRRLVMPLREVLDLIQEQPGFVTRELAPYYRDVADHVIRTLEFIDNIRDLMTSALEALVAQVGNRLNVIMKKLTAWAAILLVPTLIAGVYGMNFDSMPELHNRFGYPGALALMVSSMIALYVVFKRKDYL